MVRNVRSIHRPQEFEVYFYPERAEYETEEMVRVDQRL